MTETGRPSWCASWCTADHTRDRDLSVWHCAATLGEVADSDGKAQQVELSLVRDKATLAVVRPGAEVLVGSSSYTPEQADALGDLLFNATSLISP